jgi:hypothetical protein
MDGVSTLQKEPCGAEHAPTCEIETELQCRGIPLIINLSSRKPSNKTSKKAVAVLPRLVAMMLLSNQVGVKSANLLLKGQGRYFGVKE